MKPNKHLLLACNNQMSLREPLWICIHFPFGSLRQQGPAIDLAEEGRNTLNIFRVRNAR